MKGYHHYILINTINIIDNMNSLVMTEEDEKSIVFISLYVIFSILLWTGGYYLFVSKEKKKRIKKTEINKHCLRKKNNIK